ncbi:MAG: hypothetical protein AAFQ51_19890, partial [Pseudomonadota bacterium]
GRDGVDLRCPMNRATSSNPNRPRGRVMLQNRASLCFMMPALLLIAGALRVTDCSLGHSGAAFLGFGTDRHHFTRTTDEKTFGATFRRVGVVVPLTAAPRLCAGLRVQPVGRFGDHNKTICILPVKAAPIVWELAFRPTIKIVNGTLERRCGPILERSNWSALGCAR